MFEIGNTLREARLRRGLDILDCEGETKIRAKYLRAMEEEQFDLMPSPTYVRGFLRTYAEFLGLDGQLVLDEYESRFGSIDAPFEPPGPRQPRHGRAARGHEPRRGPPRRGRREPSGRRRRTEVQLLWLAIGGVMSVALLVWLGVGEDDSPPPVTTPPATVVAPAAAPTAPDTAAEEAPARVRKTEVVLTGVGVNGSWVRVYGRDGNGELTRLVYEETLTPGSSKTFKIDRRLKLRAANPAELEVTVDGEARELEGGTGNWMISRTKATPVD